MVKQTFEIESLDGISCGQMLSSLKIILVREVYGKEYWLHECEGNPPDETRCDFQKIKNGDIILLEFINGELIVKFFYGEVVEYGTKLVILRDTNDIGKDALKYETSLFKKVTVLHSDP